MEQRNLNSVVNADEKFNDVVVGLMSEYGFLKLTSYEYETIFKTAIETINKKNIKIEEFKKALYSVFFDFVAAKMHDETLTQSDLVSGFVSSKLQSGKGYKQNLIILVNFFNDFDINLTIDDATELLKNPLVSEVAKRVSSLKSSKEIESSESLSTIVQTYCLINNIEFDVEELDEPVVEETEEQESEVEKEEGYSDNLYPAKKTGDDAVNSYLKELDSELLTPDQEVEMFKRISEGDTEAVTEVTRCNLRLVVSIAKRYVGRGLDFLDLIQEGNIGLIKAIEKFDYKKGFKFSTYATWWIRQSITRAIADQSKTIRIPVHMFEVINKIKAFSLNYKSNTGEDPTNEEISEALNISIAKVEDAKKYNMDPVSIYAPVGEESDSELVDFLADEGTLMDEAYKNIYYAQMMEIIENKPNLSEREKFVLYSRYGIKDGRTKTLEEVGRELNVTRERIRQIESKALRKLRMDRNLKELFNGSYPAQNTSSNPSPYSPSYSLKMKF